MKHFLRKLTDDNERARVIAGSDYSTWRRIDFSVSLDGNLAKWAKMPCLFLGEQDDFFPGKKRIMGRG